MIDIIQCIGVALLMLAGFLQECEETNEKV